MRELLKYLTLIVTGLVLASCDVIFDDGQCIPIEEPRAITFVLALDTQNSSTRAAWEETETTDEVGSNFENHILPESMRVGIFTTDNELVGDVSNLLYWPINEEATRYQFKGELPQNLMTHMSGLAQGVEPLYKFMVYANATAGDNDAMTFTYDDLDLTTGAIPMWGVKQVNLTQLMTEKVQDLGEISMLRAVAKIEIVIDNSLANCSIEKATINFHNRLGYVLPTGWDSAESTEALDREQVFRGYRSVHMDGHELIDVENGRKFILYVPEYDNTLFEGYEAKISVDVNYNSTTLRFPDVLQFRNYVNGKPTGEVSNIVRNTIYRFNITAIASGSLVLNYEVADWERDDDWQWVQHFDYPTYHNPVLPDGAIRDGNSSNDPYPDRPEMRYKAPNSQASIVNEQGAFSCWFHISGPTNQKWLPSLREASDRCVIRVYKEVPPSTQNELVFTTETSESISESLKNGSKLVAYSGWYNIKVIPTDPDYTGKSRFGITYSQDWMGAGASRYLLINGEVDHIIWPNSGNEPRIIEIQQVLN